MAVDCPDGTTVHRVLRGQMGVSDGCVRRAKHVAGGIQLDGEPVRTNVPVRPGQVVSIAICAPGLPGSSTDIVPERGELSIVHEDEDIVVVDKRAGVVMYPGPGHDGGTMANHLAWWLAERGRLRGIHAVHRLDRGTSGLVAFAMNSFAKDRLQGQLHTGSFEREYLAVCEGVPPQGEGMVDMALGTLSRNPNVYGVVPDGKRAVTRYRVLRSWGARTGPRSLLRLRLETGRTHQIRIHLAHIGHPLVGDDVYGRASADIARPALHSWLLSFVHPVTGEAVALEAPPPADMQALLPGWSLTPTFDRG